MLVERFFEQQKALCMLLSPVDTFRVLAIRDLRNVFLLRFLAWGRTCYAGTGVPRNVGCICSPTKKCFFLLSRLGPYMVGLGNPHSVEYLYFAYRRLGPILI